MDSKGHIYRLTMSIIARILKAIGIAVVPPVYLNSAIERGDIYLDSKIDNEYVLDSELSTDYDSGLKI